MHTVAILARWLLIVFVAAVECAGRNQAGSDVTRACVSPLWSRPDVNPEIAALRTPYERLVRSLPPSLHLPLTMRLLCRNFDMFEFHEYTQGNSLMAFGLTALSLHGLLGDSVDVKRTAAVHFLRHVQNGYMYVVSLCPRLQLLCSCSLVNCDSHAWHQCHEFIPQCHPRSGCGPNSACLHGSQHYRAAEPTPVGSVCLARTMMRGCGPLVHALTRGCLVVHR